jgi:hypothetical protein
MGERSEMQQEVVNFILHLGEYTAALSHKLSGVQLLLDLYSAPTAAITDKLLACGRSYHSLILWF